MPLHCMGMHCREHRPHWSRAALCTHESYLFLLFHRTCMSGVTLKCPAPVLLSAVRHMWLLGAMSVDTYSTITPQHRPLGWPSKCQSLTRPLVDHVTAGVALTIPAAP
jgi:hypothetical protein